MTRLVIEEVSRAVGHVGLDVNVKDGKAKAKLTITQDPRFIEAIVLDKHYSDVPTITSRICGPCSLSHTLAPIAALERALGVEVPERVKQLRRIATYCEIVENHVVHLYVLTLPDYVGARDTVELARKMPGEFRAALRLRSAAARVVEAIAGRMVHPNACVLGGFTKPLPRAKARSLARSLREVRDYAVKTVELFLGLEYPDVTVEDDLCAAVGGDGYPVAGSTIRFSNGEEVDAVEYPKAIDEKPVPYSTAKRSTAFGKAFYVGARARLNLYWRNMSDAAREYAESLNPPLLNPFDNVRAQAIEVLHFLDSAIEALESIDSYSPSVDPPPRYGGEGVGLKEAPRGLLVHHYRVENEKVVLANIITPTAMNSAHLEVAAERLVEKGLREEVGVEEMAKMLEMLVRAYDPCMGCSTHDIRVRIRGYEP